MERRARTGRNRSLSGALKFITRIKLRYTLSSEARRALVAMVALAGAATACAQRPPTGHGPCAEYAADAEAMDVRLETCEARLAEKRQEIARDRSMSGADKARWRAELDRYRCD